MFPDTAIDTLPAANPSSLFSQIPDLTTLPDLTLTMPAATSQTTTTTTISAAVSPSLPATSGGSPYASSSSGVKRRSPPADEVTALKRQRNNEAARKYRQKRIDRISELEGELDGVKKERDDLRIRLARQEAETAALRTMLQMKSGKDA
ncbi:hypothetical protein GGR56DRAFT_634672 [Xylariaceae sp. FL0804]|nr:hypothetical protein GGR56DRAFT_634672 [Xylariaceae sp. FL0804]